MMKPVQHTGYIPSVHIMMNANPWC